MPEDLRGLFEELGEQVEPGPPPTAMIVARAAREKRQRRRSLVLAAAAAVVVAAGAGIVVNPPGLLSGGDGVSDKTAADLDAEGDELAADRDAAGDFKADSVRLVGIGSVGFEVSDGWRRSACVPDGSHPESTLCAELNSQAPDSADGPPVAASMSVGGITLTQVPSADRSTEESDPGVAVKRSPIRCADGVCTGSLRFADQGVLASATAPTRRQVEELLAQVNYYPGLAAVPEFRSRSGLADAYAASVQELGLRVRQGGDVALAQGPVRRVSPAPGTMLPLGSPVVVWARE